MLHAQHHGGKLGIHLGDAMDGSEGYTGQGSGAGSGGDEKGSHLWNLLPSFDPSTDDPKEYVQKVRFLHTICPAKDKPMLAPRLAMQLKGTAWSQIQHMDTTRLTDPNDGIKALLEAVATWQEASELQTYDKFERALYKTLQKNDETAMSYVSRMNVAWAELGNTSLKEMQAFIKLRQSSLTTEDKKRILVMTGGEIEDKKIDHAMRQLSTKVLVNPGDRVAKKVYPVNFVDDDDGVSEVNLVEDEPLDEEAAFCYLAETGDPDAALVMDFEEQLIETCQGSDELASCFNAYSEARSRLREKIRSRGFWPPRKGKGKGGKSMGKGAGKGGWKPRQSLADRIANSHCRICGKKGHWKQECPERGGAGGNPAADANFVEPEGMSEEVEFLQNLPNDVVKMTHAGPPFREPEKPQAWQVMTGQVELEGSSSCEFIYVAVSSERICRKLDQSCGCRLVLVGMMVSGLIVI